MAYTINLTNGAIFATIPDGTRDTSSSLVIIGKNYTGYGEFIGENFVRVLENHANTLPPDSPLTGQLWYDINETTLGLNVYDGTTFKTLGTIITSVTEPVKKVTGDTWYDTSTEQMKVFNGTTYELVGPLYTNTTGKTGPIVQILLDTTSTEHVATVNYVAGNVVSIEHKDTPFTLNAVTPIAGFPGLIYPGIHLVDDVAGEVPQFTGTATNSIEFDGVDSNGYLSALNNTATIGTLGVLNDDGLAVGADSDLQLTITGTDAFITNSTTNGRIVIQAKPLGLTKDVITVAIDGAEARARVSAPLIGIDIANMDYVDTTTLALDGSRPMTGNLDAGTKKIVNLADPIDLTDAATKQYVLNTLLGIIFPVGSYFMGPNPNTRLPGTWAQLPANTFLMSSASGFGSTGGANSITLTSAQLPSHRHSATTNTDTHYHKLFMNQKDGTAWRSITGYPNNIATYIGTGGAGPDDIYHIKASTSSNPTNATLARSGYDSHNHSFNTNYAGSGATVENRPNYETVEVWKRTA